MDPEAEGVQLGHYQLTRLLGTGGMGEVYLARDLVLKRDVAIKFVAGPGSPDDTRTRRLMQEARAVAALDHPCICPVHDIGVDPAGRPYMVMQYVLGETLAARLARGPLPVRDALTLCARVADALSAAHRRGIIHRDLKPQNIIVTPSGAPKLLDFGIAKFLPSRTLAGSAETATGLTTAHALVGTPAYMSPEQVQQQPVDARSDLFALGAILFETLTGRRAFEGGHTAELLAGILHVHPPAPSTLRDGLDPRHDELVRRLLAKEPADRFQSADEVVGALRLLQPDTSRTPPADTPGPVKSTTDRAVAWVKRRRVPLLAAAVLVLVASIGLPRYFRPVGPTLPADARVWYDRGTEALREGSFHTAEAAFEESARLFGNYPATYARLAEARAELDDGGGAQNALLSVTALVNDQSRLPADEQLRLDAIRAMVLRKVDDAVALYKRLAERHSSDPGAWIDLGRAQEAAGHAAEARASYERAVAIGPQYAAAFLRLGMIDAGEGRREQSLAAYAEAERLYRASKNAEGEAEVLIRKAELLDGRGEFAEARAALDRALALARTTESASQIVRAQLRLSSVSVSEGRLVEAERLASATVQSALDAGLQALAADGLIDLGAVLQARHRPAEAEAQVRRALDLAERRGALRTAARARTQLASILQNGGRPEEALAVLPTALDFFRRNNYRRLELTAMNIAARALQRLDRIAEARAMSTDVLKIAELINDDRQVGLALMSLSGQAADLGALPDAVALRLRAEKIHREQKDVTALPYDLSNRAEMLIDMGRLSDADAALRELETGIAQKLETYMGRQRRVTCLRALAAIVARQTASAIALAKAIEPGPATDPTTILGAALLQYAEAHRLRAGAPASARVEPAINTSASPAMQRELHYWVAATHLANRRGADALTIATAGLGRLANVPNDELEWRLAAIGSLAARSLRRADEQRLLHDRAVTALARLRAKWGDAARDYDARPDLVELRTAAGV